jgi:hypothetical protein
MAASAGQNFARNLCGTQNRGGSAQPRQLARSTPKSRDLFRNNVLRKPWEDVLALVAVVMMAGRFEVTTVINKLSTLNTRFTVLFEALGLTCMKTGMPTLTSRRT